MASPSTTGRGLYVALTRGRRANHVLVVTETHDLSEARGILEHVITSDRADVPAVPRRQQLSDDRLDVGSAEVDRRATVAAALATERNGIG